MVYTRTFPLAARSLTWVKLVVAGVSLRVKLRPVRVGCMLHNVILVALLQCFCTFLIHSSFGLYGSNLKKRKFAASLNKSFVRSALSGRISRYRKHIFALLLQHAKQNRYEKAENKTFEQVAKLRYWTRAVTNKIHKEIWKNIGIRKCLLFRTILPSAV